MSIKSFQRMSTCLSKSTIVVFMVYNLCLSAPVPSTLYSSFVEELQKNKCNLPSSIFIANIQNKTVESSLHVCNDNEHLKYNKELAILCTETFDLFKNIFCPPENGGLDKIEFRFSENVCQDLETFSNLMPESPLKHLTDKFTCPLLCTEDAEETCQVLWNCLYLTQMKSKGPSTTKVQLKSDNPVEVAKYIEVEKSINNDSKHPTSSIKQISESKDTESNPNDPVITKNTNEKTSETELNSDITHNNEDSSIKSVIKSDALPEVEKFTVEKAISEQSVVSTSNKLATTSLKLNTSPPVTDPQNANSASLDLSKPQTQPSDQSNAPSTQAKNTETIVTLPELKSNPEPAGQQQKKVQEETPAEMTPKEETKPSAEAKENPDEDDTNPQTISTIEGKKEETKEEASLTPEEKPINPKPDLPVEVSEYSISSEPSVVSVPASKDATVSPASPTPSLEKMEDEIPMPNEKDTDQYTDLEGDEDLDGEYSKQEFGDNGMYEPSKSKEPISESPKAVVIPKDKEPVVSERDDLMDFNRNPLNPSGNSYGRGSEEIQVLATFPSQEDGHFFFYLLTVALIFMAGYLVFHNKQKIIALIVEGRHERRRRSHGLGYRKLETK